MDWGCSSCSSGVLTRPIYIDLARHPVSGLRVTHHQNRSVPARAQGKCFRGVCLQGRIEFEFDMTQLDNGSASLLGLIKVGEF